MLISVVPAGLEEMFFEIGVRLPEGWITALQKKLKSYPQLLPVMESKSECRVTESRISSREVRHEI